MRNRDSAVPVYYESEDHLVQRAVTRDREAFSSLYDSSIDKVYRHVFYRVSSQSDAEDITQEVFARAWKAIDRYKSTGAPFVAWLISIAGNLIVDHYRKRQRNTDMDNILKDLPAAQVVSPEEQAEINLDNAIIKEAVLKLKGDKQKVILMHFIDGMSYTEIAAALHKTENAIRVIQFRALSDLKRLLPRD